MPLTSRLFLFAPLLLCHGAATATPSIVTRGIEGTPSAVVVGAGGIWVVDGIGVQNPWARRIDPKSLRVLAQVRVTSPLVAASKGALWSVADDRLAVIRIDPTTDARVETATEGLVLGSVSARGGVVWVGGVATPVMPGTRMSGNWATQLDEATGVPTGRRVVPPGGANVGMVAVTGRVLWATEADFPHAAGQKVATAYDAATGERLNGPHVASVALGAGHMPVALSDAVVWRLPSGGSQRWGPREVAPHDRPLIGVPDRGYRVVAAAAQGPKRAWILERRRVATGMGYSLGLVPVSLTTGRRAGPTVWLNALRPADRSGQMEFAVAGGNAYITRSGPATITRVSLPSK